MKHLGKGGVALAALAFIACSSGKGGGIGGNFARNGDSEKDDGVTTAPAKGMAKKVLAIFETSCASCHSADRSDGGIGDILDLENLILTDQVTPGSPKRSPVFTSMKDGKMPPDGKVSSDDLALVEKWILGGALTGTTATTRTFVGEASMQKACAEDLLSVAESSRKTTRYLSLVHLYDASVSDKTIATAVQGVAKLLNSLSLADKVKAVDTFNSEKTLIRIDLGDFGWDEATWSKLSKPYPYLIVPKDSKALGVMQEETGSQVPVIRADWFLGTASRPPLYYQMMGSGTSLSEFEKNLNLTLDEDIAGQKVIRAGFNNSTVSTENRVIERHETGNGPLWRSYEFGTSENTQNVLKNPLGPTVGSGGKDQRSRDGPKGIIIPGVDSGALGDNHAFNTDGGEFIYSLPNGMLGFYIIGQTKNRIDEAPVAEGEEPIIAGMSCMSCHSRGVIEKDDMVRAAAAGDAELSDSLAAINAIYPESKAFNKQVADDSESYEKTLVEAGVNPKAKDPVYRIAKPYNLDVSKEQAAAELGVTLAAFEKALESDLEGVADKFHDDAISRADFKENFKQMLEAVKP